MSRELSNTEKAALTLLSLGQDIAAEVLGVPSQMIEKAALSTIAHVLFDSMKSQGLQLLCESTPRAQESACWDVDWILY